MVSWMLAWVTRGSAAPGDNDMSWMRTPPAGGAAREVGTATPAGSVSVVKGASVVADAGIVARCGIVARSGLDVDVAEAGGELALADSRTDFDPEQPPTTSRPTTARARAAVIVFVRRWSLAIRHSSAAHRSGSGNQVSASGYRTEQRGDIRQ